MNKVKKYLKVYGLIIAIILISAIFLTILNYFNILNGNILKWIKILIPIIAVLIGSIKIGKNTDKKGYLEGLKFGGIFIIFLIIFNFLAYDNDFNIMSIVFYFLILLSSTLGAMLGINKKNNA